MRRGLSVFQQTPPKATKHEKISQQEAGGTCKAPHRGPRYEYRICEDEGSVKFRAERSPYLESEEEYQ